MSNLAFQEREGEVKPAVEIAPAPWEPPSYDELYAFYLDKVRERNNRKRLTASDCNLIRGLTVLSLEFKRQDHFRGTVRDCLENIKEHYEVVT